MITVTPRIFKDIPVPPRHETDKRSYGKWVTMLRAMDIGDCVFLTRKECLAVYATAARHKIKLVKKLDESDCEHGDDNVFMVWRVANEND
tara:strand:- start:350 stop:619 length:270 start_codon:yes stop_codon:yes gene_type:complete